MSQAIPFVAPQPFTPTAQAQGEAAAVPPQAVMPTPPAGRPKKDIPTTPNKVVGARVVLTYVGEDGKNYEAMTTIDPEKFKVQSYALNIEEKHEKKRDPETKDLIGFEDTGERVLTFKLRYHVR